MKLVVDASVVVAWLFADDPREIDGPRASALFNAFGEGMVDIVQPTHWLVEVAGVASLKGPTSAHAQMTRLLQLPIPTASDERVFHRAIDVATRRKVHVFDSMYHAVAQERDATLVTADQKYFQAARSEGQIRLLHQFQL